MLDLIFSRSIPEPNSGCWLWEGRRHSNGYGQIRRTPHILLAHRVSYEEAKGPIPAGRQVCHRCDVPACVNPDHLFLADNAGNVADRVAKGRSAAGVNHGMYGRGIYGVKNGNGRLTPEQISEMRSLEGKITQRAIAASFGVTQGIVWRILRGKAHNPALRALAQEAPSDER